MTKAIRIENADTSDHKVVVEVWENEILTSTHELDYPTALTTLTIWNGRHLVIREKSKE